MFIVVTMTEPDARGESVDFYRAFESYSEAHEFYIEQKDRLEIYSASLCGVIESTDYLPQSQYEESRNA
jgi:hypothetical protein